MIGSTGSCSIKVLVVEQAHKMDAKRPTSIIRAVLIIELNTFSSYKIITYLIPINVQDNPYTESHIGHDYLKYINTPAISRDIKITFQFKNDIFVLLYNPVPGILVFKYAPLLPIDTLAPFGPTETLAPDLLKFISIPGKTLNLFLKFHDIHSTPNTKNRND